MDMLFLIQSKVKCPRVTAFGKRHPANQLFRRNACSHCYYYYYYYYYDDYYYHHHHYYYYYSPNGDCGGGGGRTSQVPQSPGLHAPRHNISLEGNPSLRSLG